MAKQKVRVLPPRASAPRKVSTFTPRVVTITPALATDILNHNVANNRALSERRVAQFARDMNAGRWGLNGETIIVAKSGKLLDGQHRLWACIEADTAFETLMVEGVDDDVLLTIDQGKSRSYSDVLRIRGGNYNTAIASALRWWYWYESGSVTTQYKGLIITAADLEGVAGRHPELSEVASIVASRVKVIRLMGQGVGVFAYAGMHLQDSDAALQFLSGLDGGTGLTVTSPIYQLRERLIQNKASRAKLPITDVAAYIIKAWNLWINGKTVKQLTFKGSQEAFPQFGKLVSKAAR